MSRRPRIAFAMSADVLPRIFPEPTLRAFGEIAEIAGFVTECESDAARGVLADVEVLVTGWGAPVVDGRVLDAAPRLAAILHAAGSVKAFLAPEVLDRGIRVSTAATANAVPVAEYTVAMIVLAGKRVLPIAGRYRRERREFDVEATYPGLGNHGHRVGIVGASTIGRLVIGMLRAYDVEVVVHDPYLSEEDAHALGVEALPLDELIATSDVVSVHAPSLPSTVGLIDARRIGMLRPGATLVNTARGELVDQEALTRRVVAGEIFAVLDVTVPWVLDDRHPLYDAENALLTPHIAGSLGTELDRLSSTALDELRRWIADGRLTHEIRPELLTITA